MTRTTRAQRIALKRLYHRWDEPEATYRQFRETVEPTFGMDGAIVVPWCNMWICIEKDGYSHS